MVNVEGELEGGHMRTVGAPRFACERSCRSMLTSSVKEGLAGDDKRLLRIHSFKKERKVIQM